MESELLRVKALTDSEVLIPRISMKLTKDRRRAEVRSILEVKQGVLQT